MKKLLLTCTDLMGIQFLVPHINYLSEKGFDISLACSNVGGRIDELKTALDGIATVSEVGLKRSPLALSNFSGCKELKNIITKNKFDIIWTNEPVMGVMTRLAAQKARKMGTKVIYMAHGFHFFKRAPLKNWLVFYTIEKIFARFCDMIITINQEDFELAKRKFKTNVHHIHGIGVKTEKFHPIDNETRNEYRKNLELSTDDFVIVCTGELNENKNQTQLINAASLLRDRIPNLKILLAGKGDNRDNLVKQIETLNLQNTVTLLGYRKDLDKIVPAADLVVSCSKREGLPLNIIEAMFCAKPIVATYNRGHNELIQDGVNGYLVSPDNAVKMAEYIYKIYDDAQIAVLFGENSKKIAADYTITTVQNEISDLFF